MKSTFLTFATSLFAFGQLFAQCETDQVTVKDWCENQYAHWEINDPEPSSKYHWYEPVKHQGNIVDFEDMGYGTEMYSKERLVTPNPTPPDFYFKDELYYSKEEGRDLFLPFLDTLQDEAFASDTMFKVELHADMDVQLKSFKIPVILFSNNSLGEYGVDVSINATSLPLGVFQREDFIPTHKANVFLLEIPMNTTLTEGDYVIQVERLFTASHKIDAFPAYSKVRQEALTDDVLTSTTASVYYPGYELKLFDIDYDILCPKISGGISQKTTVNCCEPVLDQPKIVSTQPTIVTGSDVVTLQVENAAVYTYYNWYKEEVLISSGLGNTSETTSDAANYCVRKAHDPQRMDDKSCFAESCFKLNEQMLFAALESSEVCLGDYVALNAEGDVLDVLWSPSNMVEVDSLKNTFVGANELGANVITGTSNVILENRILNGDFENGNNSFKTDFVFDPSGFLHPGKFIVHPFVKPGNAHWNFDTSQDTTRQCSGEGKFLYADGQMYAQNSGLVIWQQEVDVDQLTEYTFALDHANISWNASSYDDDRVADVDVTFEVSINDELIGEITTDGKGEYEGVCRWKTNILTWNSAQNETANIQIKQKELGSTGYDFAIDNVRFGLLSQQTVNVNLNVEECYWNVATQGACKEDSSRLFSSHNAEYVHWEDTDGNRIGWGDTTWIKPVDYNEVVVINHYAKSKNLISNGDFEAGEVDFNVHDLIMHGNIIGYGAMGVVEDPSVGTSCGGFCNSMTDASYAGNKMLYVDPPSYDEDFISWDFEAVAGKQYIISFEVANVINYSRLASQEDKKESIVQVILDGDTLNTQELEKNNKWKQTRLLYNIKTSGKHNLKFRAYGDNSLEGNGGNDFVLDEVSIKEMFDFTRETRLPIYNCDQILSEEGFTTNEIQLYPNPSSTQMTISGSAENATWEIVATDGTLMEQGQGNKINVQDYPKGMYLLKLDHEVLKFVKE